MKNILFIAGLFSSLLSFSQGLKNEPQTVQVRWKAGDEKTVSQIDSTIIYINGELYMSSGTETGYTIKIVNLKDTIYEVLFSQTKTSEDIHLESKMIETEPVENLMNSLLAEIQQQLNDFDYSFFVDKNTGQAFRIKNETEIKKKIEEITATVLKKLLESSGNNNKEKQKKLESLLKQTISEKSPEIMETMMNSFNYVFQAYSFIFVPNDTYTSEMLVYNIDQIQNNSDAESPAILVTRSIVNNSTLNVNYEYQYDHESAYQQYIVAQGKENEISRDQFTISEIVSSDFNLKTSWITNSNSFVDVKMGPVSVKNRSYLKLR